FQHQVRGVGAVEQPGDEDGAPRGVDAVPVRVAVVVGIWWVFADPDLTSSQIEDLSDRRRHGASSPAGTASPALTESASASMSSKNLSSLSSKPSLSNAISGFWLMSSTPSTGFM